MDEVDIADVAGELLALPPERFTEARNAAAKQLRADGRKDEADAVKRLPRPPLALWALNRLAREGSPLVDAFLAAAEGLRSAYRTGGDIRAATAPQREAESALANAAAKAARAEGKNVTDAVMSSIGQTLRAAAADEGIAEELRTGLLLREPAVPSISDLLGSLPPAPATSSKPAKPKQAVREAAATESSGSADDAGAAEDDAAEAKAEAKARDEQRKALREQLAEAKAEATEARREARAASDAATKAREQWERAKMLAEQAKQRSDEAEEHAEDLRAQLDEL